MIFFFSHFVYSLSILSSLVTHLFKRSYFLWVLARLAVQHGAAGIIVSNHGARQLDYVPATIMALEEVNYYFFPLISEALVP